MRHVLALLMALPLLSFAADKCLYEWTFETEAKVKPWAEHSNMVSNVHSENGVMKGVIADWDPWLTSPDVAIKAKPWQYVEVEAKSDLGGGGQIFYTDTKDSPYEGFQPSWNVGWTIIGDNEWHTYRIDMFWAIKQLLKIRLDLAQNYKEELKGKCSFEVRRVRIMDPGYDELAKCVPKWNLTEQKHDWKAKPDCKAVSSVNGLTVTRDTAEAVIGIENKPVNFSVAEHGNWLVLEMAVTGADAVNVEYFSSASRGLARKTFEVIGDGTMRYYNVDMSSVTSWDGDIYALALTLPREQGTQLTVKQLWISDEPGGPASIFMKHDGLTDALNRVNRPAGFSFRIHNIGGEDATNLRIAQFELPAGVKVVPNTGYPEQPMTVEPFNTKIVTFKVVSAVPVKGQYRIVLAFDKGQAEVTGVMEITPSLGLPKMDYVPEPQPPESDYEVGALYFPGWGKGKHWGWQRIYDKCPERKPVLGWFDECLPECVDWQIKWLSENGIKFFLVDWYWSKGNLHLDHWLKAFYQCRYRKYMKWAMMWANHNAPGSHSLEDMEKVTHFWIDHYFNTPEYYKIDGKPVVMMWSPDNMERDLKGQGGAKALIDLANKIAREAGLPGIHFTAMKWPEAQVTTPQIQRLANMGFESTSIYHYMGHGGKATNTRRFSFELVADSNKELWEKWYETGILPFFTNLSTGWDDRPWNGGCEIYGRSAALFKRICEDAKAFADRTGLKTRILMSPINEWGEGSYAEPNREFGFGMYEAVRDTFCKKPAGGWPLNYGPEDIGLPSFDDPDIGPKQQSGKRTAWDFEDGGAQGWRAQMGIGEFKVEDGKIKLTTSHWDSAVGVALPRLRAKRFPRVVVRMKVSPSPNGETDKAQLFWGTTTAKISEGASVIVEYKADGQFHDLVFNVSGNTRYSGFLNELRFDPIGRADAKIEIDSIRLEMAER